jgi:hypothetical protein
MLINIRYNGHMGSADNGGDGTDNVGNDGDSADNVGNVGSTVGADNVGSAVGADNDLHSLDMFHIDLVVVCPYEIPPLHF